ncbi:MAG: cbb3-type cytochrome c oxidase subunit I [Thermodesulfovibrionales bacterium]|nr:cbb3-type cytochrome c oxidase subunit I [Thermodesulfovibrionales bacterium]
MDRFVKNFIVMSIVYLAIASILGVFMIARPSLLLLKFVHSHLMLIGWVSMMIYGVGYHILPRFAGKLIKSKTMAELQFWLANIGLVGMLGFYTLGIYNPSDLYKGLIIASGAVEVLSIFLFFYNMIATLYSKQVE